MIIDRTKKRSPREAFGKALVDLGKTNNSIVVLDADLSASTQTKLFAKEYPDRFLDMGIAEQDLIGTAAGLSATGKIPFAATFAVFATGRTYDQIRNTVCYSEFNVKIIGTHGGVTVGEDGATHQALEDVALMANLPNMTVIVPADYAETYAAVKYSAEHKGAVYIRIARASLPDVFEDNINITPVAKTIKEGSDLTVITNGETLQECIEAVNILADMGISAELLHMPFVKPFDGEGVLKSAKKTGLVVTVENHSIKGGLGSAVCEYLSENYPVKVIRLGVNDQFGTSGTANELLAYFGLNSESIVRKIVEIKNDTIKSCN
ncbi:MAG: transketolase family protein [Candidatus Gastranaerophilales bacterium]|nr:transketolase family protein [Candidatus Gastranaerophilales bacterium]